MPSGEVNAGAAATSAAGAGSAGAYGALASFARACLTAVGVTCAVVAIVMLGLRFGWQAGLLDGLVRAQLPAPVRLAVGDAQLTPGWRGWRPTLAIDEISLGQVGDGTHPLAVTLRDVAIVIDLAPALRGAAPACHAIDVGTIAATLRWQTPAADQPEADQSLAQSRRRANELLRTVAVTARDAASKLADTGLTNDRAVTNALASCGHVAIRDGAVELHARDDSTPIARLSRFRAAASRTRYDTDAAGAHDLKGRARATLQLRGQQQSQVDVIVETGTRTDQPLTTAADSTHLDGWLRVRPVTVSTAPESPQLTGDAWLRATSGETRLDVVGDLAPPTSGTPTTIRGAALVTQASSSVRLRLGEWRTPGVAWRQLDASVEASAGGEPSNIVVQMTGVALHDGPRSPLRATIHPLRAQARAWISDGAADAAADTASSLAKLDIERLTAYATSPDSHFTAIIEGTAFTLPPAADDWSTLQVTAPRLHVTEQMTASGIPALRATAAANQAVSVFANGPAALAPERATALSGAVSWVGSDAAGSLAGGELRVTGLEIHEGDAKLFAEGRLALAPGGAPLDNAVLAFTAHASALPAPSVARRIAMLPVRVALARWLRQGITRGTVVDVDATSNGKLADLLGERSTLNLAGIARDVELQYLPDWPALTIPLIESRMEAGVLQFNSASGQLSGIDGATLGAGEATLRDLDTDAPALSVQLEASGDVTDLAAFLAASPRASDGERIAGMGARGAATVDLALDAALSDGGTAKTDTKVTLQGARVTLAGASLRNLRGTLRARRDGDDGDLIGSGLRATAFGLPLQLDFSRADSGAYAADIVANADVAALSAAFAEATGAASGTLDAVDAHLAGSLELRASLAAAAPTGGNQTFSARVTSDLRGLTIDLPSPLGKRPEAARPLTLDASWRAGDAATWSLVVEALGTATGRGHELAGIRFGDSATAAGNALVSGQLDGDVDLVTWAGLLGASISTGGDAAAPGGPLLDLQIKRLGAGGLALGPARLQLRSGPSSHRLQLDGPRLAGTVTVPRGAASSADPVELALERLMIDTAAGDTREARPQASKQPQALLRPQALPALRIDVKRLVVDALPLGSLTASVVPVEDGLQVRDAELRRGGAVAAMQGAWQQKPGASGQLTDRSTISAQLRADDIGEVASWFGYDDSVGGSLRMRLDGAWPGALHDVDLGSMTGEVSLSSRDGHLPEARRGAFSRLFTLMLLPSLPRRLQLDFSDVTDRTLDYQTLEGTFAIARGQAVTDDLSIATREATIDIRGTVQLEDNRYDQRITVTPRLGSTLLLAPLGLVQKLIGKDFLDDAFAIEYDVTGPIDAPVIERRLRKLDRSRRED